MGEEVAMSYGHEDVDSWVDKHDKDVKEEREVRILQMVSYLNALIDRIQDRDRSAKQCLSVYVTARYEDFGVQCNEAMTYSAAVNGHVPATKPL